MIHNRAHQPASPPRRPAGRDHLESHHPHPRSANYFLPRSHWRLWRRCRSALPASRRLFSMAGSNRSLSSSSRRSLVWSSPSFCDYPHQLDCAPTSGPLKSTAVSAVCNCSPPRSSASATAPMIPERHGHHHHGARRRRPAQVLRRSLMGSIICCHLAMGGGTMAGGCASSKPWASALPSSLPSAACRRRPRAASPLVANAVFGIPRQHHPHHHRPIVGVGATRRLSAGPLGRHPPHRLRPGFSPSPAPPLRRHFVPHHYDLDR